MIQKTSKFKISISFFFFKINLSDFSDSIMNDDRVPIVNHLVEDLHKRLNDLENLYSTVNQIS
jgi:hypothetical protein